MQECINFLCFILLEIKFCFIRYLFWYVFFKKERVFHGALSVFMVQISPFLDYKMCILFSKDFDLILFTKYFHLIPIQRHFFIQKPLYFAICVFMVQISPYLHHRSHTDKIIFWIWFLHDRVYFKVSVYQFSCFYYKNKLVW